MNIAEICKLGQSKSKKQMATSEDLSATDVTTKKKFGKTYFVLFNEAMVKVPVSIEVEITPAIKTKQQVDYNKLGEFEGYSKLDRLDRLNIMKLNNQPVLKEANTLMGIDKYEDLPQEIKDEFKVEDFVEQDEPEAEAEVEAVATA